MRISFGGNMTFKEARKAAREMAGWWAYIYKDKYGEWNATKENPEKYIPKEHFHSKDSTDFFFVNKAGVILHKKNYDKCCKVEKKKGNLYNPIFIWSPRNRKENETKEEYHKYLTAMRIL